jgi:hypothetical protein
VALLVKDANTTTQSLATGADSSGNLVPVHIPALLAAGVATPVSTVTPLPVINAASSPAIDGSGMVQTGGSAQSLFGGIIPTNGWLIANNSSATLYVSDVGVATPGGASIPISAGSIFATPSGYRPSGAVSLYGATTGQVYAGRRW